jgi:hypothetical protein
MITSRRFDEPHYGCADLRDASAPDAVARTMPRERKVNDPPNSPTFTGLYA